MAIGCCLNPELRHEKRRDLVVFGTVKLKHRQHFVAHNARKRCVEKNFDGIHGRFQKYLTFRDAQLKVGWTEEKSIEMDELALKDITYRPSLEENER